MSAQRTSNAQKRGFARRGFGERGDQGRDERLEIRQAIAVRSEHEDGNWPAAQILLVAQTLVECQERILLALARVQ